MKIILEGLTGTGKTQTIDAMHRLGLLPSFVAREEETFGEVMEEMESEHEPSFLVRRLAAVHRRLRAEEPRLFLLERFHPSYYALQPRWEDYDACDAELAARGASIVLLFVDEADLGAKAWERYARSIADWAGPT